MFSLQQLFGKSDQFYRLLEEAATAAHQSVKLVLDLMKAPPGKQNLDDLTLARRKEKKIAEEISTLLVRTFVTGLEREDIEALSLSLYKIPKTTQKFAERYLLASRHLESVEFSKQAALMERATEVVLEMVKQLRDLSHVEKLKELNDKLQFIEGEADRLMLDLFQELYSGRYDALRAIVIRDLYELMEKAIDRCRDAGNVVMHIVLKNS